MVLATIRQVEDGQQRAAQMPHHHHLTCCRMRRRTCGAPDPKMDGTGPVCGQNDAGQGASRCSVRCCVVEDEDGVDHCP